MESRNQIRNGAFISYLAIIINIVATLLYTPWMVQKIGKSDYGLYTLAISLISIFLMDFGIGSVVTRFVAKYKVDNDTKSINNLLGIVFKLFIIIDFVILLILAATYFSLEYIYVGLKPQEMSQFKILFLIIAGFSVISFPFSILNGIFSAYEYFVQLKLCELLQKVVSILLVVALLLFGYGVISIVAVNAFVPLIVITIKLVLLKRNTPIQVDFTSNDKTMRKEMFDFSIWITIIGIAQRLTYNIAPSILGVTSTSGEIALYAPASAIAGYFYIIAAAIDGLFLPTVFRKLSEKKEQDIRTLMIKIGKFQLFVLGWVFVGFVSVGKEFMTLWMGKEYLNAYYCTVILVIPTLFEYSQQIARTTILAKNKVKLQSIGLICTSILNIGIAALLSYYFGAIGVCSAICITAVINLIYMNVIYYKVLHFGMIHFYKSCYIRMLLPIGVSLMLSLTVLEFIEQQGWLWLILKGMIVSIVFGVIVFFFGTGKEERNKLIVAIKKRGEKKDVNGGL